MCVSSCKITVIWLLTFTFCFSFLQLSPAIVGGLHNIARTIESRSYTEGLNIHTHIVSSSNFSETSAFMPVLKVVLTQANKLGVWLGQKNQKKTIPTPNSSECSGGGRWRVSEWSGVELSISVKNCLVFFSLVSQRAPFDSQCNDEEFWDVWQYC